MVLQMNDLSARLAEFMEQEVRSCSMDFGCITPEYVYRMWGGSVAIEEIANAMSEVMDFMVQSAK
jgi:hypothetical protein